MGHESTPYIPLEELKRRSFSSQVISPLTGTPSSPQEPPGYGDHIDMESDFKPNKSVPPRRNRRRPTSRDTLTLLGGVWQITKTLILPFVAIGYLSFCYIVHQRVVPLKTYGLFKVTPDHLAAIKGGITSVSIIIVSIALWPLTDLLSDLKSEEFFRVLSGHEKGVPLSTLNQISSPSFGQVQTLKAMISRHCSRYWIASVIGSLMVLITSTLAPAALSIQSVLSDGEIMAFAVGAIPSQIVWNASDMLFPGSKAADYSDTAASILWAEMELGVQYAFTAVNSGDPSFTAYIVPTPPDLSTSTSSRWLTDVIGLNPTCDWASTNISQPISLTTQISGGLDDLLFGASLVNHDLDVAVTADQISFQSTTIVNVQDPTKAVSNHTTQARPTDGSLVILFGQCVSNCSFNLQIYSYPYLNFSGIPTFTVSGTDATWDFSFLVCKPNVVIETREVRNEGHGLLTVQSTNGKRLTKQGNLHPVQTPSLLSVAMMSITGSSGPSELSSFYAYLGSVTQTDFLFGKQQIANLPTDVGSLSNITVLPIENLAQTYGRMLQSVAKSYTAGYLGTAYVPGRLSTPEVVFAASLPHIVVSTVMLVFLSAMIIFAHFRAGKGSEFTLINVAAAVHGSELPEVFSQMKAEQYQESRGVGNQKGAQQDMVEMMGKRRIILQTAADGSCVLHAD